MWSKHKVSRSVVYTILGAIPTTIDCMFGLFFLIPVIVTLPIFSLFALPWLCAGIYGAMALWGLSVTPWDSHINPNSKVVLGVFVGCIAYFPYFYIEAGSAIVQFFQIVFSSHVNYEEDWYFSYIAQYLPSPLKLISSLGPWVVVIHFLTTTLLQTKRRKYFEEST